MIMAPGKSLVPDEASQEFIQWAQGTTNEEAAGRPQRQQLSAAAGDWFDQPPRFFGTDSAVAFPPQLIQNLNGERSLQRSFSEQTQYGQRPLTFGAGQQPLPFSAAHNSQAGHHQVPQGNLLNQSSYGPKIDGELAQDLYRLLQGSMVGSVPCAHRSDAHAGNLFQQSQQQLSLHGHHASMNPSLEATQNRIVPATVFASVSQYDQFRPSRDTNLVCPDLTKASPLYPQGSQFEHQAILAQLDPTLLSPHPLMSQTMDRLGSQMWTATSNSPPPPSIVHKPVLRALSAYNFFFRDERDRIVDNTEGQYDTSEEKKASLLAGHWHRDRTTKRRHRKTHGKIAFTDLSKVISKRWKSLEPTVRSFYREVAADDLVRYHQELDEQKARINPDHNITTTTTARGYY